MGNTFENTDLVLLKTIDKLENYLGLAKVVDRDIEGDFQTSVGDTIWKRRPYYFAAQTGAVISSYSDIEEGKVAITVDQRRHIPIKISSQELALDIDAPRVNEIIDEAAREMAQQVETSIADAYKGIWNYTNATGGATLDQWADADAKLDEIGVEMMSVRYGFFTPRTKRTLAKDIAQDFSRPDTSTVEGAMKRAAVGTYSNVDFYQNQSLATHTSGIATGTPLVNGASQEVTYATSRNTWTQSLITDGWTNDTADILVEGDVITIAGVFGVNNKTKEALGELQQFVVTADAAAGSTTGPATLTISPPIIISGAYQTVSATPADDAVITVVTGASQSRKENLLILKDCINLSMVPLPQIKDGATSSTRADKESGISIRVTRFYDGTNDELVMRFDVLYGVTVQNGYYGHRIATAS